MNGLAERPRGFTAKPLPRLSHRDIAELELVSSLMAVLYLSN